MPKSGFSRRHWSTAATERAHCAAPCSATSKILCLRRSSPGKSPLVRPSSRSISIPTSSSIAPSAPTKPELKKRQQAFFFSAPERVDNLSLGPHPWRSLIATRVGGPPALGQPAGGFHLRLYSPETAECPAWTHPKVRMPDPSAVVPRKGETANLRVDGSRQESSPYFADYFSCERTI